MLNLTVDLMLMKLILSIIYFLKKHSRIKIYSYRKGSKKIIVLAVIISPDYKYDEDNTYDTYNKNDEYDENNIYDVYEEDDEYDDDLMILILIMVMMMVVTVMTLIMTISMNIL